MKRTTVLLIDDDTLLLQALESVLAQEFEVVCAGSGEEAMAIIASNPPDVVVLDVMMSYPSEGYDLARVLKHGEHTGRIPIILLTGVTKMFEARSRVEGSWEECDRFMTKPPDFNRLREAIRELAARHAEARAD